MYTAIFRKIVGRNAPDNPKRHCGWFEFSVLQRNLKELVRKAKEMCFRVLKASNKSRFDSYSCQEQIISHISFRDCREHIFSDNLSRNIEIAVYI